uniref:Mu-like prophage I protein n=1 Tax=Desulfobacca acetoxidans TaxID=60893 RepID=A0A7C5AK79_9BACT
MEMEKEVRLTLEMTELPEWLRLLPLGRVELVDGRPPFEVDAASLADLAEAFAARGTDLVIDYEHQSLKGVRAPAAGWIKELAVREDGLWARVEWTSQAREYLSRREYRYFSPVLRLDPKTRRPRELLNVALTNVPAIRNLTPLVAKWGGENQVGETGKQEPPLEMLSSEFPQTSLEETDPSETDAPTAEIKRRLGVEPESRDSRLWGQALEVMRHLFETLGLPADATAKEVQAGLEALKAGSSKLKALENEIGELKAEIAEAGIRQMVDDAVLAGKITPAQKSWAMAYCRRDLEGFKEFIAQAPKVVPVGERLNLEGETRRAGLGLTPEELALCQALNLSPEVYMEAKAVAAKAK